MKLYKVRVTFETVIAANNEEEAERKVQYGMSEIDDEPDTWESSEIKSLSDLPYCWNGDCIPWSNDDIRDKTVAEILNEQNTL